MKADEVDDKIRENFSFLIEDWNFSQPKIFTHSLFVEYFYVWKNLAVEIFFDIREQCINAYIVKLLDGTIPDCYLFIAGVRYKTNLDVWFKYEFPDFSIKFSSILDRKRIPLSIEDNIAKYKEMLHFAVEKIQKTPVDEIMKV